MTAQETLALLREYESRNVTFIESDGSWPMVWERASGARVWDAEGRRYLDLTAAFGVAAAGHANPRVVRAGQAQMARLLHAMGDVHPHPLKAQLARELSRLTFERWQGGNPKSEIRDPKQVRNPKSKINNWKRKTGGGKGKTIFCNSGFEAVEAALKTALLATGKPGVIVFEGGYHGLGYGALNATHREHFRLPFVSQLREFGKFVPFPTEANSFWPDTREAKNASRNGQRGQPTLEMVEARIRRLFRGGNVGAILVEPIQARGGIRIPAPGLLPLLRRLCDESGGLLILDEIYTGFGRTGKWFACEHSGMAPDLICLGKALTGGFPLSACVGRAELMDAAWPPSSGEAIHTSTFLGHPVGCAMALAQIREIETRKLVDRSAKLGEWLLRRLGGGTSEGRAARVEGRVRGPGNAPPREFQMAARGLGLLAGVEVRRSDGTPATEEVLGAIKTLLHRGFIFLPEGEHGNVISFTPPLTITARELGVAVAALQQVLSQAARGRGVRPPAKQK